MIPLPPSPHFYTLFTLLHTLTHSNTLLHTLTNSDTPFHTLPPPTLHFPYPSYHRVKPPLHVKVDEHCMQNHTKQHLHFYTLLINTTTKKNTGNRQTVRPQCISCNTAVAKSAGKHNFVSNPCSGAQLKRKFGGINWDRSILFVFDFALFMMQALITLNRIADTQIYNKFSTSPCLVFNTHLHFFRRGFTVFPLDSHEPESVKGGWLA